MKYDPVMSVPNGRLTKDECSILGDSHGWMTLSTAPRDIDILMYTPPENHRTGIICGIHVGWFRTDVMMWHTSDDEWELAPSHWQYLPEKPEA